MNKKNLFYQAEDAKRIAYVSVTLSVTSILLSIFSIIAKQYIFLIIFGFVFIISLVLCLIFNKKKKIIYEKFKTICPKCEKEIKISKSTKYAVDNVETEEVYFNTSISTNKDVYYINNYYCDDCKFCYTEIEMFKVKGEGKKLYKRWNNINTEYEHNY